MNRRMMEIGMIDLSTASFIGPEANELQILEMLPQDYREFLLAVEWVHPVRRWSSHPWRLRGSRLAHAVYPSVKTGHHAVVRFPASRSGIQQVPPYSLVLVG